jgi:hypothetical protein
MSEAASDGSPFHQTTEHRMPSELIFAYDLSIDSVTDYGLSMEAVLSGAQNVPPQGAQFDVSLSGSISGRIAGRLRAIDYLHVRGDGRRELELRGTIETDDGNRIVICAEGVAIPRRGEPMADIAVRIDLATAAVAYAWVNAQPAWGTGEINLATGKLHIDGYLP